MLHLAPAHFICECVRRGVKEIAIGDLTGIREEIDYAARMKQRLHAWPYCKSIKMIRYKAALLGITVRDDVDKRGTSRTCHACGTVREGSRVHRGLYRCRCGWTARPDVKGALNIYERVFQLSPVKGRSGRLARPVVPVIPAGMAYGPRTEAQAPVSIRLRMPPHFGGRRSPGIRMEKRPVSGSDRPSASSYVGGPVLLARSSGPRAT
ncbi:zinc ribbon domain-containing protein [Thermogemmatispora sp.]|uniref:zinc ribbon domain-containing protein n=1 Tax=Thermogemmatispora sp. TaxID=1968838 RepID=UPI0035E3F7B2